MLDMPFPAPVPTRLYALLLKLRPLQPGTLMPFSGELVHGAFLHWLENAAPNVARWLHEGNKRRLFTCSSLQFPIAAQRLWEAQRANVHLPVEPDKTYCVRVTLLLGELLPLFHEVLARFNTAKIEEEKLPFMQIGKRLFALEEVIAGDGDNGDASGWTGFTSFSGMVAQAQVLRMGKVERLAVEFASLTTLKRSNQKSQVYGGHYALLPLPQYIFPGLAKRWQELAPPEFAGVVQMERIAQYIENEGIVVSDYDLKPHQVYFTTHVQPGFVGRCTYDLRSPDEAAMGEAALTVRQQLWLLGQLAFYCGVGYKTAMGMGQVRPL